MTEWLIPFRNEMYERITNANAQLLPPSERKRKLETWLRAIQEGADFADLSHQEKEIACRHLRNFIDAIEDGGVGGSPPKNAATLGYKLGEKLIGDILPHFPNLNPCDEKRGPGRIGRHRANEMAARMIRDAPARADLPPEIAEILQRVRRDGIGSDKLLSGVSETRKRKERRDKNRRNRA